MAADITVFAPPEITVTVVNGPPPVDQTAAVALLEARVAQLAADLEAATSERDAARGKIAAALAALA